MYNIFVDGIIYNSLTAEHANELFSSCAGKRKMIVEDRRHITRYSEGMNVMMRLKALSAVLKDK